MATEFSFGSFKAAPASYSWTGCHGVHDGGMDDPNGWIEFCVTHLGGKYQLSMQFAAGDSRPCQMRVGGNIVADNVAAGVTGGFGTDDIAWVDHGQVDLGPAGTVTVGFKSKSFMPHLAAFSLTPMGGPRARQLQADLNQVKKRFNQSGHAEQFSFSEGEQVPSLPAGCVDKATYGDHENARTADVTGLVQGRVSIGAAWDITNAQLGGDPCPGYGKTLQFSFRAGAEPNAAPGMYLPLPALPTGESRGEHGVLGAGIDYNHQPRDPVYSPHPDSLFKGHVASYTLNFDGVTDTMLGFTQFTRCVHTHRKPSQKLGFTHSLL